MSQRGSGYERNERDLYETPAWVTQALVPHLPKFKGMVWEPAAGSGKMVNALKDSGFDVLGTDISGDPSVDFLGVGADERTQAIITNPPYELATEFIKHALSITRGFLSPGLIAMLLRTDFDHAQGRQDLFSKCQAFSKKIVLTKRIVWFDAPKAAPSFNHAWFIWDWQHEGPPTLAYGPQS